MGGKITKNRPRNARVLVENKVAPFSAHGVVHTQITSMALNLLVPYIVTYDM